MDDDTTLDPGPWIRPTVLEPHYEALDRPGIFHVTTQIVTLERERMMRSRYDLRAQGIQGLGGRDDDSPHLVSTVFDYDRAWMLWGAMRAVCRAVHGTMTTVDLLLAFLTWTDFPDSWRSEDDLSRRALREEEWRLGQVAEVLDLQDDQGELRALAVAQLEDTAAWMALVEENAAFLNAHFATGQQRYWLVQALEQSILNNFPDAFYDAESDGAIGRTLVGFVSPYELFARVQPDQISIVQLAAKKGAKVEFIPDELELRFQPEDLRIAKLRVEETGPIVPEKEPDEDDF